jgi:ATP-dependent protease ClpP protease subunit
MNKYIQMRMANRGKGSFRAEANVIWLYDAIAQDDAEAEYFGGISPSAFIAALAATTGPVTLRVNSPGGSVFGAQAMIAAMRAHPHPITAQIDALAASAASVIAANCAKCVMVAGSMQMIHRAWGIEMGNCEDMRATANLLEKIDGLIVDTYAARAGGKVDAPAIEAMMADETWFTPAEAVAAGLADEVLDSSTQRPAPKNTWNLAAFQAVPAALADDAAAQSSAADDAADEPTAQAADPIIAAADQAAADEIATARAEHERTVRAHRLNARLMAAPV